MNNLQKAVLNWVLEMSDYHFTAVHHAGATHNNADALSRLKRVDQIQPTHSPEPELNSINWWGESDESVCIKCHKPHSDETNELLICDFCSKLIHQACHKPAVT